MFSTRIGKSSFLSFYKQVANWSSMITYPNYKFYFPIKALGMFANRFGNEPLEQEDFTQ